MVTAVVRSLEAAAIDDALDLFALLMQVKLISTAKRATNNDRLSTLPRLEKASRLVTAVWRVLGKEMGLVEEHGTDLTSWTRTWPGSPRWSTPTSTAWAAKASPPARHARACAHCVTRRPSTSTRTTRAPANDAALGRVSGRDQ
jgi:hypothetical protein